MHAVPEKEFGSRVEGEPGDELLKVESNVRLSALPDLAEGNVYRTGDSAHGEGFALRPAYQHDGQINRNG